MRSAALPSRRLLKRLLLCAVLLVPAGVVASACSSGGGEAAGPGGSPLTATTSKAEQKNAYMQAFSDMQANLEDPSAPPIATSIKKGDRAALIASSQRWDDAIAALTAITPPDDIKVEHAKLIAAMRELSKSNFAMAKAAPHAQQVRMIYQRALSSKASIAYGDALNAIQKAGYPILDQPSTAAGTADPLANAGDAGGSA